MSEIAGSDLVGLCVRTVRIDESGRAVVLLAPPGRHTPADAGAFIARLSTTVAR